MKHQGIFLCLFLVLFVSSGLAADPVAVTHWYSITISEGASSHTFTGSSSLDSEHLGAFINNGTLIVLEDLRHYGIMNGGNTTGWQNNKEASKLFLLPRTVLYFSELPGDPLMPGK